MKSPLQESSQIAALLLVRTWQTALFLGALHFVPTTLEYFTLLGENKMLWRALQALIEISCSLVIYRTAFSVFAVARARLTSKNIGRFFFFSVALWAIFEIPFILFQSRVPELVRNTVPLLIAAGVFVSLRYYFSPLFALFSHPSLGSIAAAAADMSRRDWLLPAKICFGPLAITALTSGLIFLWSPDGREEWVVLLSPLPYTLFSILTAYTTVAAFLRFAPEAQLESPDEIVTQALRTHMTTEAVSAPTILARYLHPKHGTFLFVVATLLQTANIFYLHSLPPAATIEILETQLSDRTLTLNLRVSDEQYELRGFQPLLFQLAGERGTPLVTDPLVPKVPAEVRRSEDDSDVRLSLPPSRQPVEILVRFKLDREASSLANVSDLYLWYRGVKIAQIQPPPQKNAPATLPAKSSDS